jgi:hypothetical protein
MNNIIILSAENQAKSVSEFAGSKCGSSSSGTRHVGFELLTAVAEGTR